MSSWRSTDSALLLRLVRVVLLLLAGSIFCGAWFEHSIGEQSFRWSKTEGTIQQAEIKYLGRLRGANGFLRNRASVLVLAYEYRVEGKLETGYRIRLYNEQPISDSDLQQVLNTYPVGSTVTVYFDPRHPSQSCLIPGPNYQNISRLVAGAGILLAMGIGSLFVGKLGQKLESE